MSQPHCLFLGFSEFASVKAFRVPNVYGNSLIAAFPAGIKHVYGNAASEQNYLTGTALCRSTTPMQWSQRLTNIGGMKQGGWRGRRPPARRERFGGIAPEKL